MIVTRDKDMAALRTKVLLTSNAIQLELIKLPMDTKTQGAVREINRLLAELRK